MIALLALGCARDERPDVVIVTVDTMRADRLGFGGNRAAHTPVMDGLAAAGRVYDQATTPFPRTTPALGALQTGLRPVHHGAREVGQVVTAEGRLAGWLAAAGWQTFGVSAIQVAGPDQHLDHGFDRFEVHQDARAGEITAAAMGDVGRLWSSEPLYAWVHYADPHFPYLPEAPIDAPDCRHLGEQAAHGKLDRAALFSNRGGTAARVLAQCQALYDGEISAADAAIGDLLAGLDQVRGHRARIVVLTADHGENQGENGLYFEHGPDLADAAVRVPLVIGGPGFEPGHDGGIARLEDVAPTILAAVGVPIPDGLDGVSLLGQRPSFAPVESGSPLQVPLFGWLVSGKADRWCLNEGSYSWCTLGKRAPALFDHDADPDLKTDVSSAHPDVAARLSAAASRWGPGHTHLRAIRTASRELVEAPTVDGWVDRVIDVPSGQPIDDPAAAAELHPLLDQLSNAIDVADGAPAAPMDEKTEEALKQLGYVQ